YRGQAGHVIPCLVHSHLVAGLADNEANFGFGGDATYTRRHLDRLTGTDDRVVTLEKRRGSLTRSVSTEIGGMSSVIEPDTEDLTGPTIRRVERFGHRSTGRGASFKHRSQ